MHTGDQEMEQDQSKNGKAAWVVGGGAKATWSKQMKRQSLTKIWNML